VIIFFFSSRRRHTRYWRDWSSDVCSSDLGVDVDVVSLFCSHPICDKMTIDSVKKQMKRILHI